MKTNKCQTKQTKKQEERKFNFSFLQQIRSMSLTWQSSKNDMSLIWRVEQKNKKKITQKKMHLEISSLLKTFFPDKNEIL